MTGCKIAMARTGPKSEKFVTLLIFLSCNRFGISQSIALITDNVFWSEPLENDYERYAVYNNSSLNPELHISNISLGCGKELNRLASLSNGCLVCLRYRQNLELVQGEIFSYYLGKILGIKNFVHTRLEKISFDKPLWKPVLDLLDEETTWEDEHVITLTHYEANTQSVKIPHILIKQNFALNKKILTSQEVSTDEALELLQWSDLMVFDYLIGNFDRVVSSLYNLQWHEASLLEPVNNLIRTSYGLWLFIDNEDGLFHAYRLIEKYEPYLRKALERLCVFRRETARRINELQSLGKQQIWMIIRQFLEEENSDYHMYLPKMPERHLETLMARLDFISQHIESCRGLKAVKENSE